MAYTQYPLKGQFQRQPTERLLYITNTSYGGDWDSVPHSHSFTELFYVTDGSGFFCTDSEKLPIEKDFLVLINPNVRHTETSSCEEPLTYIALGIDDLQFCFAHSENESFYCCDFRQKEALLPLLKMMLSEATNQSPLSGEICQHFLSILLLIILRNTENQLSPCQKENIPSECKFVKDYLDGHCAENISLNFLARLSHLNKYYLSHIFSKTYGISPINYLLERRILNSQELLKNTDYSIAQIAQIAGFSSSSYFSQSFKKHTGITAAAYRKHAKGPL